MAACASGSLVGRISRARSWVSVAAITSQSAQRDSDDAVGPTPSCCRACSGANLVTTVRTLRRQAVEVRQLTLALGEEKAEGLVFRFALEASVAAGSPG